MQNSTNVDSKYLEFIDFNKLFNWSVAHNTRNTFSYNDKYAFSKIGDVIKRNRKKAVIKDEIEYQRVTIKLYGKGVTERDRVLGKSIGTKNQFEVQPNQFIISKIDARNGAFGIVPNELSGAITTQDFLSYNIDKNLILIDYLNFLSHTSQFLEICQTASSGTTGRKRIDEKFFLDLEIPLPTIKEQEVLVKSYQKQLNEAENLEQASYSLEEQIDIFILEQLGIKLRVVKKRQSGKLYFAEFNELFNWVHSADEATFFEDLQDAKYPVTEIGLAFDFISRPWKKKEESKEYIELGGIDPNFGVMKTKTVYAKKAPSRATQTVKTGDLIIGTTRPYLKKFAIIQDKNNGDVASSGFSTIQENKEKYNLYFLNEVLKSPIGIKQFEIKMTGALYPAITQADLLELKIPLPSIDIQNNIADNIQQMKDSQKDKFQQAQQLKKQALLDFENAIFKPAE